MANHYNSKLQEMQPLWGILGGMGPLASSEFLSTVYRLSLGPSEQATEQCMPRIILVSDPTIPDRTKAIKERSTNPEQYQEVIDALQRRLEDLLKLNADRMAIACVTAHHFLEDFPKHLKSRLTSLLDLVIEKLSSGSGKYILLRTNGALHTEIFEHHPRWSKVSSRVVSLNPGDQQALHDNHLYQIKMRGAQAGDLKFLEGLRQKYQVDGFIAGCTEVHLLTKGLQQLEIPVIDPLYILAERIAKPVCR